MSKKLVDTVWSNRDDFDLVAFFMSRLSNMIDELETDVIREGNTDVSLDYPDGTLENASKRVSSCLNDLASVLLEYTDILGDYDDE